MTGTWIAHRSSWCALRNRNINAFDTHSQTNANRTNCAQVDARVCELDYTLRISFSRPMQISSPDSISNNHFRHLDAPTLGHTQDSAGCLHLLMSRHLSLRWHLSTFTSMFLPAKTSHASNTTPLARNFLLIFHCDKLQRQIRR